MLIRAAASSPANERDALKQLAAAIWRVRERTEIEAAELFKQLSLDLQTSGAPDRFVKHAVRCCQDELVHARHCAAVASSLDSKSAPLEPLLRTPLGPPSLNAAERALYAAVAVGCVTETLSVALLLELRPRATHSLVRAAFDAILSDEIRHSRLGWAYLRHMATTHDVRWLGTFVGAMLHAACDDMSTPDLDPPRSDTARHQALAHVGILSASEAATVIERAVTQTILPGLAASGVCIPSHDAA